MTAPTTASPGWYADPGGAAEHRYWDGERWTDGVATGGAVSEQPLDVTAAGVADTRAALPLRALLVAVAGAVVGTALAAALGRFGLALVDDSVAAALALSQVGLWVGLLGACIVASRHYGTGRVLDDYAFRFRPSDVALGFGLSWLARLGGIVLVLPLVLLSEDLMGSNTEQLEELASDPAVLVVLLLAMVLGAPVIEELFFRGLLLRSLQCKLRAGPAVAVQAVLFGLVHVTVGQGAGNISIVIATAAAGVVFGVTALRCRRLGPAVTAHGFFNLVPAIVLVVAA